jgi:hypothetical protein
MRRLFSLIIVLLMIFSLVGCGDDPTPSGSAPSGSTGSGTESTAASSEDPSSDTSSTNGSSLPTETEATEPVIVYETRYFVTKVEHHGEQPSTETWTYDAMGNILTHVYTAHFTVAGDNPSYSEFFRYDEQGRLIYEGRPYIHYSYTYNDQGLIAVKTILNKDDSIAAQWSYTYNEKGDVIKEDNGSYGYTYTYVYGETIIQEQQPFGSWGSTEVPVRRTMDLNRNVLLEENYLNGEWKTQYVARFDKNGNRTYFAAHNGKNFAEAYEYDDLNNLLMEMSMDLEGNVYSGTRYTYTADGKVHTKRFYDRAINDFSKAYMEFVYDERGNVIKHISHMEDGTTSELDVSPPADQPQDVYDDAGNLLIDYQGEGTKTEYTYIKLEIPTK